MYSARKLANFLTRYFYLINEIILTLRAAPSFAENTRLSTSSGTWGGKIENFASTITTLRKRRCSISLILQELSQLDSVYGRDEARTIFSGGCANKLFFSGLDLGTTEFLERALGRNTEYDTIFGGIDERARTIGVPLLAADEVRMLRAAEGILISGRERPVRIRMPAWFEDGGLKGMVGKGAVEFRMDSADEEVRYLDLGGPRHS